MNIEPRQVTLSEKLTITLILLLFGFDTASLFGDHWLLYTIFIIVFDLAVWAFFYMYVDINSRKEYFHFKKWRKKTEHFWLFEIGTAFFKNPYIGNRDYVKCCELIDKLCKDKYVRIEDKKLLYDWLCEMWTKYGMGEGIYTIPIFIQEKWKKAQAEDKLRQLKKDF